MRTVSGVYTSAKIFTDTVEEYALAQIQMLCDNPAFQGSRVRVMPDVHPGKVGTVGFTATVTEQIAGAISDTVAIEQILRPVYNFKAGGDE